MSVLLRVRVRGENFSGLCTEECLDVKTAMLRAFEIARVGFLDGIRNANGEVYRGGRLYPPHQIASVEIVVDEGTQAR